MTIITMMVGITLHGVCVCVCEINGFGPITTTTINHLIKPNVLIGFHVSSCFTNAEEIELFHELMRVKLCVIKGSQGTNMKLVGVFIQSSI